MDKHIPKGYKQTEVGVIPADWDISALGDLVKIRSGESPSCLKFAGKGFPYFKVDELNNSEKFAAKTKYFISAADKLVPKGSLIFPKRGASIFQNKIRILKNDSYMDTNLMTLTVSDSISNEYCYYQLIYIGLSKVADTTSVPQINNKHIKPFNIPFPLQLEEQQAIATALSNVDNLITSLEQLIEKKKAIKQGTMQELLTGRRRLEGFGEGKGYKQTDLGMIPEDWEVRKISNIGDVNTENLDATTSPDYKFKYISINDIELGRLKKYTEMSFRQSPSRARRVVKKNDILISTVRPNLKSHHIFKQQDDNFICSTGFSVITCFSSIVPRFIYSFFFTKIIERQIDEIIAGSNYPAINGSDVEKLLIPVPCTSGEQSAIAQVLSNMDSEIENLEVKVDKYKQIKQGMMQNLLTGRIRLV